MPLPAPSRKLLCLVVSLSCMVVQAGVEPAASWSSWRGADGSGASSSIRALPVPGAAESEIAWESPVPGIGTSSPVIFDGAVYLTSQVESRLVVLKYRQKNGKLVWEKTVGQGEAGRMPLRLKSDEERARQRFHASHNLASPTPAVTADRVVVHFGNGLLASLSHAGHVEWKRDLRAEHGEYTIWWGHANSPVIHGDLVINVCIQDSLADLRAPGEISRSYVVAHDLATGELRWKNERQTGVHSEPGDSYVTPLLRRGAGGSTELVVFGAHWLDGYDPSTGRRLWKVPGLGGNRAITGHVLAGELVLATAGMKGPLQAVRVKPDARGDLDLEKVRAWEHRRGTPDAPTPVVWSDHVYLVNNQGIARCLEVATGEEKWAERLGGGEYRASPVAAAGRIVFTSTGGRVTAIEAGPRFEVLGTAELGDEILASPALAERTILWRGHEKLICLRTR